MADVLRDDRRCTPTTDGPFETAVLPPPGGNEDESRCFGPNCPTLPNTEIPEDSRGRIGPLASDWLGPAVVRPVRPRCLTTEPPPLPCVRNIPTVVPADAKTRVSISAATDPPLASVWPVQSSETHCPSGRLVRTRRGGDSPHTAGQQSSLGRSRDRRGDARRLSGNVGTVWPIRSRTATPLRRRIPQLVCESADRIRHSVRGIHRPGRDRTDVSPALTDKTRGWEGPGAAESVPTGT